MATYKFYLQPVAKDGTAGTAKDLETDYSGLHYLSCKGLENVGAPKDIYLENYPEADGSRVYFPTDTTGNVVHLSDTTIELSLLFEGDSYRTSYNSFCSLVRSSRLYYWDTARLKKVLLVLNSEVAPEEDTIKGIKYIKATFKFTNIWGVAKTCTSGGVV